jgi:hypothetical protein
LHFWKSEIFFILGLDTISEKQKKLPDGLLDRTRGIQSVVAPDFEPVGSIRPTILL